MSNVLDQSLDLNGQELHRINSLYPLPEFVKSASQADVCGNQDVPPHLYGDITRRLYPCHTAAATVVSAIFFHEKAASLNKVRAAAIEERINNQAKYFKVDREIKKLREKIAAAGKYEDAQIHDNDYAIMFSRPDGTKERHYPMRNPGEVKAAADWLIKNRDELPYEDRRRVADKILEKAAVFGVGLNGQRYILEKTAGLGLCAGSSAAELIRTRIRAVGHSHKPNALQVELEKLANMCEEAPDTIRHYTVLTKIAGLVDQFDREHGLTRKYDDVIARPEDILFAVTEKSASEASADLIGNTLTGNYYKRAELATLPMRDLADTLGDDFASEVSTAGAWVDLEKLAAIVPTLPLGDAEQFDEVVAAAGIRPFATKSASVGLSISPEVQTQLAAQHKSNPGSLWDRIG